MSLFGYRPSDVNEALAARDRALAETVEVLAGRTVELDVARCRIGQLETICDQLSARVVERERERDAAWAEFERLRDESEHGMRALTALAEELDGVRRQARGQATRIRLRALRDAVELSERITEMTRRPAEARDRLLDALQEAIGRIGAEDDLEAIAQSNGHVLRPVGEMFDGMVEVEVGPLDDFSQLVGFEDAAGAIGATSEISVTRFAQGRATLEMKLAEPVELLRELEQRTPFEFRVRDQRSDRVVLDVDAEAA
jgi:hypothetical protein